MIISDLNYFETASANVAGGSRKKRGSKFDLEVVVQINKNKTDQYAYAKAEAKGGSYVEAYAYNDNYTYQSNDN